MLILLLRLSKMEEGRKSKTLHFTKALKAKMICWLEIYLNEQNPANGTWCSWKWQMGSFKVWLFAWNKIIFLISYFSSGCYSVLHSVTASHWQSQISDRLIYPDSLKFRLKGKSWNSSAHVNPWNWSNSWWRVKVDSTAKRFLLGRDYKQRHNRIYNPMCASIF